MRGAAAYGCCAVQEAGLPRRRSTDSDARVGYRIPVCSSGAASVCKRASTSVGHTNVSRVPHRGPAPSAAQQDVRDRKSTRLNSSHANISYAVFCLKKKPLWFISSLVSLKL